MTKITLKDFCAGKSQAEVARHLGVTREAISQMVNSEREIYVDIDPSGRVSAWERRAIPARRRAA